MSEYILGSTFSQYYVLTRSFLSRVAHIDETLSLA